MANKAEWKAAKAALDVIEAERTKLVEPTQLRFEEAKARLEDIEEASGEPIAFCEGCSDPIFEGEPYHRGRDVELCESCAPTYGDLAKTPDGFFNTTTDEPVGRKDALKTTTAHVARGGSLDDKMVSP